MVASAVFQHDHHRFQSLMISRDEKKIPLPLRFLFLIRNRLLTGDVK